MYQKKSVHQIKKIGTLYTLVHIADFIGTHFFYHLVISLSFEKINIKGLFWTFS